MPTVGDVYKLIDDFAPFSTQDKFDNSGLLVGSMNAPADRTGVCLDITGKIVEEAIKKDIQLIVSHHPVIFHKLGALEHTNPVFTLARYGISAICAHTNVDMAKGGISDIMLELLDFKGEAQVLEPINPDGSGYGRIVELDIAADAEGLAKRCRKAFGCSVVRYYDSGRVIRTVAVCSGAGGSEENVEYAAKRGVDALITGDVKHSGFMEAVNRGITVIDAGHFHTENIVCPQLAAEIEKLGGEVEVLENSFDVVSYI